MHIACLHGLHLGLKSMCAGSDFPYTLRDNGMVCVQLRTVVCTSDSSVRLIGSPGGSRLMTCAAAHRRRRRPSMYNVAASALLLVCIVRPYVVLW